MTKLYGTFLALALAAGALAAASQQPGQPRPAMAEQLFALANQARVQAGEHSLVWDQALANAAMRHCQRMAGEGPIAHRYGGEASLADRAAMAGAHFGLIEENIAVGSYAATIHQGWLESPGHRANLLNRDVDHVGVAVVWAQGVLFAVEDFSQSVPVLTSSQVESAVAGLIRASGVSIVRDPHDARAACQLDSGLPPNVTGKPAYVMRWQGADLNRLPQDLVNRLGSGRYRSAEIGSCAPAPQTAEAAFTQYRIAVLLY